MFIAIATATKITFLSYYGYRHWCVNRAGRHDAQAEGLGMQQLNQPTHS
jgi:hypothetical protein